MKFWRSWGNRYLWLRLWGPGRIGHRVVPTSADADPGTDFQQHVDRNPARLVVRAGQSTPRGRNWTLIRGPIGRVVLGTACSQVRWQLPPITSRSPCPTS